MNEAEFHALLMAIRNGHPHKLINERGLLNLGGSPPSSKRIDSSRFQRLVRVLRADTNLKGLCLDNQAIGDLCVESLDEVLFQNKNLVYLSLDGNFIGFKGAQILGNIIKLNRTLTTISIGSNQNLWDLLPNNNIGDEGVQILADALEQNDTLTALYIDGNQIGDIGAKSLALALKKNSTLKKLDLTFNNIGDTGAQALLEMLKTNTTLIDLELDINNNINQDILNKINGYLKRNRKLAEAKKKQQAKRGTHVKVPFTAKGVAGLGERMNAVEIEVATSEQVNREAIVDLQADVMKLKKTARMQLLLEQSILRLEDKMEKLQEGSEEKVSIKAEIQRLKESKADKETVKRLGNRLDKLEEVFKQFREGFSENVRKELQEQGIEPEDIEKLQKVWEFMAANAQQLKKLSNAGKAQDREDAELAEVLTDPEARLYYYNLLGGLNQLHMAAMLANSGYYAPNKKDMVKARKGMKLSRHALSIVNGIIPIPGVGVVNGSMGVADVLTWIESERLAKGELKLFRALACSSKEMNAMAKEVAIRLAKQHQGNLTPELSEQHLEEIKKAVLSNKEDNLIGTNMERATRNEKIVDILVGAAGEAKASKPVKKGKGLKIFGSKAKGGKQQPKQEFNLNRFGETSNTRVAPERGLGNAGATLKSDVNARLTDIYDGLFDDIPLDKKYRRAIRDGLRVAILRSALGDPTFKTAFLEGDVNNVAEVLEKVLKAKIGTTTLITSVDDVGSTFISGVVAELSKRLKQQRHTTVARKASGGFY